MKSSVRLSRWGQFQEVRGDWFLSLRMQGVCRLAQNRPVSIVPMNVIPRDGVCGPDCHRLNGWRKRTSIPVLNSSRHKTPFLSEEDTGDILDEAGCLLDAGVVLVRMTTLVPKI